MKKIVLLLLLINSIFFSGFISPKREAYKELKKADQLYSEKKLDEAFVLYNSLLNKNYYIDEVKKRIDLINYQKENYTELDPEATENNYKVLFNQANVLKKLGDSEEEIEKKIEKYQNSLQKYKEAMKSSNDLNIRKNYEFVNKILSEIKEQQNKENKENKENEEQSKDNSQKNKDSDNQSKSDQNEDNKQENSSENKSKEKDEQNNSDESEEDNEKKTKEEKNNEEKSDDQKNNAETGNTGNESDEKIDENKLEEILYHLKKLEMNEKEDLKNNQRVLRGETDEKSKNW